MKKNYNGFLLCCLAFVDDKFVIILANKSRVKIIVLCVWIGYFLLALANKHNLLEKLFPFPFFNTVKFIISIQIFTLHSN